MNTHRGSGDPFFQDMSRRVATFRKNRPRVLEKCGGKRNKSSAVAVGDRVATRHGPKMGAVPFGGGGAGSQSNTMWPRPPYQVTS